MNKRAVLISTYELGRQPFGLASPAAWLRRAGWDVTCVDLTRQPLPASSVETASLIGFHLPMHTATRLAAPAIARVRRLPPAAGVGPPPSTCPTGRGPWLARPKPAVAASTCADIARSSPYTKDGSASSS